MTLLLIFPATPPEPVPSAQVLLLFKARVAPYVRGGHLVRGHSRRSPIKSVRANIRRGVESMHHALLNKTSVHRAMYRNELGWIDFVWGDEGKIKASGKTKGAMGIAHILEARQRKDGMSRSEVERMLLQLPEVIARGRVARNIVYPKDATDPIERQVTVQRSGKQAILVKHKGSNAWVLNGWEVK